MDPATATIATTAVASGMPTSLQFVIMIIGPVLAYLTARYQAKQSMEQHVDGRVQKFLERQDTRITTLEARVERDHKKISKLSDSYSRMRTAVKSIHASVNIAVIHLDAHFDFVVEHPDKAQDQINNARDELTRLCGSLEGLMESSDPLDADRTGPFAARESSAPEAAIA